MVKDQKLTDVEDVLSTVKRMQSGAKANAKTKTKPTATATTASEGASGKDAANTPGKKKSGKKNFKNVKMGENTGKSGEEDMGAFM